MQQSSEVKLGRLAVKPSLSLAKNAMHLTLGVGVTLLLFFGISLGLKEEAKPILNDRMEVSQVIQVAPPQPPDTKPQTDGGESFEDDGIPFLLSNNIPEVELLKTDVRPVKADNIVQKTGFDISKFLVESEDLNEMVIFEGKEVDRRPEPIYRSMPEVSTKKSRKEKIRVMFVVDELGKVGDSYVLESSNTEINSDVLLGVKTWTFHPAKKDGNAVKCWVKITIIVTPSNKSAFEI